MLYFGIVIKILRTFNVTNYVGSGWMYFVINLTYRA